jgi:beta-aspartyl-peptidase (threonine type)
MMKLVLAKHAADQVAQGVAAQEAAEQAIHYLKARLHGHGGIILLDARGGMGIAHNTPRMAWGWRSVNGEQAGVQR